MDLTQFIGRFHVLALHLPIGILMLAAFIEAYFAFMKKSRPELLTTMWICGAFSAVLTVTLGLMLSLNGGYDEEAIRMHRFWGITLTLVSIGISMMLRQWISPSRNILLGVSAAQLFALFMTGHYGGNLTHGPTYLVEHAPEPIRALGGMPPREKPRPQITSLEMADPWLDVVKPAMAARCVTCHNSHKSKGGLKLETFDALLEGGKHGPAIVPGNLKESVLYQRISLPSSHSDFMPAEGKTPLTDEQVDAIKWWIEAGALKEVSIASLVKNDDETKLLSAVLGLEGTGSGLNLPEASILSSEVISKLEQAGFVVKQVASDVHYYDLDYTAHYTDFDEDALAVLLEVKDQVVSLNLAGCGVVDAHVEAIANLTHLMRLRLERNNITTEGAKHLARLKELRFLNLYGTSVDDGFLQSIDEFSALEDIYLWQTAVTPAAMKQLSTHSISIHAGLAPRMNQPKAEQ